MKFERLLGFVSDKTNFENLGCYYNFCNDYLNFALDGLQAVIGVHIKIWGKHFFWNLGFLLLRLYSTKIHWNSVSLSDFFDLFLNATITFSKDQTFCIFSTPKMGYTRLIQRIILFYF